MKYLCPMFILLAAIMPPRAEALAWILVAIAALLPIISIGFKWTSVMRHENRRIGPALDEEDW